MVGSTTQSLLKRPSRQLKQRNVARNVQPRPRKPERGRHDLLMNNATVIVTLNVTMNVTCTKGEGEGI